MYAVTCAFFYTFCCLKKKQNIHTHKKPHEEFEAVNILCFFGEGCRWGFTFHLWGQQPAPHPQGWQEVAIC